MSWAYWCSTERAGTLAATDLHADRLVAAIAHAPSLTPQLVNVIVEVVERNPYLLSWLHRSSMSKIWTCRQLLAAGSKYCLSSTPIRRRATLCRRNARARRAPRVRR